jgi:hypothetical protein
MVQPPDAACPLYLPRTAQYCNPEDWLTYDRPVPQEWHQMAAEKGFRIARRVRDRLHLALECKTCGAQTAQKVFTLRTAQPACGGCRAGARDQSASAAAFTFLRRDRLDRHYAFYRLPCGHEVRRQIHRVDLIAETDPPEGRKGYHCPVCHTEHLAATAASRGWQLIGPDMKGNVSYRLYGHADNGCGHVQRVAIANMETGRFSCEACGECWASAPSAVYLSRFRVPGVGTQVKLGMSRDPVSRHRHQLKLRRGTEVELLTIVPMETGKAALKVEKELHRRMLNTHPDLVTPRTDLADWIGVKSEVYAAEAERLLRRMLEEIEDALAARKALSEMPEDEHTDDPSHASKRPRNRKGSGDDDPIEPVA